MQNWFECGLKYDKTLENGMQKKVTEPYLVDALSFTEAEARITEEMKPYMSGEFGIQTIKRAKLSELFFNDNGDKFFKAKVLFVRLDERAGTEKKTPVYMLAQATDIDEAQAVIKKGMEGTLADYEIAEVKETKIMDVFLYNEEDKKKVIL